jgi:hypothetical protein
MDLLERYLQAVRFLLPRRQQDDIVRELSENLISQMEDRQEELGRPLREDEQADILRRHGHPMLVAGRYRSRQHLIGPAFFSIYIFVLKVGLAFALVVTAAIAAIASLLHGDPVRHAVEAFLSFPGRALMVLAWTTLVFAALDFAQSRLKLTHNWDPGRLPKVIRHEHRISRSSSLFELLLAGVIIWLLLLPQAFPMPLMGPAADFLDLAPIWHMVYVPILGLAVATAVLAFVDFVRPYWTAARSLARAAIDGMAIVVLAVLLRAGEWVVAKPGATLSSGISLDHIVGIINRGVESGLVIACIISLIEIIREALRWKSRHRTSSSSGPAPARIL